MTVVYTGTPANIKAGGIPFTAFEPVDVPDEIGALLIKKPGFSQHQPEPPADDETTTKPKRRS